MAERLGSGLQIHVQRFNSASHLQSTSERPPETEVFVYLEGDEMGEKTLFVIDVMPFLYRGHFAFIKNPRMTATGINTSALVAFASSVTSILSEYNPTHVAFAMDPDGPTFRHEAYPEYKAGREKMPEDLAASIPRAFELAEALNIPVLKVPRFEADDIMGTLARMGSEAGFTVYIATPDKDAAQLVGEKVRLYRPGRGGAPAEVYDEEKVKSHWSLSSPAQMIDYLAIAGDSSDNIPGMRGIGEKTATKLLADWGSVENAIAHASEIKGKLGEKVAAGAKDALASKFLTTIRTDVPLDVTLDDLMRREADAEKLKDVCAKYELMQLARKLLDPEALLDAEPKYKTLAEIDHDYRLVKTEAAARELAEELMAAGKVAFDTETTGLDPRADDLVGISFSTAPGKAWYVPIPPYDAPVTDLGDLFAAAAREAGKGPAMERVAIFADVFADPAKTLVAHNAKFDIAVLERYGIRFGSTVRDTMLEHYVLDAAARHGKEALSRELLGREAIGIESLIGERKRGVGQKTMGDIPPEEILDYAAQDADLAFQWDGVLRPRVAEAGALQALTESEEPLVPILLDMEREGVKVDVAALKAYGVELEREITSLACDIRNLGAPALNLDSPKQLGEFLFDTLKLPGAKHTAKGQYSTDEKTLARLQGDHPVVGKILEYRTCTKLKSTYVDKLPQCVDLEGRVHTTFTQAFAETGRLASSDPNLQNIPVRTERGKAIRAAIVARDENHRLVSADYSQIELRIMAAMSGDEHMIAAFNAGADIHRDTAARVYDVMPGLVTDDMRSKCKMVNFGIIYGISAFGLAQRLGCPRREASDLIESYFRLYPRIKAFMDASIEKARKTGYAVTALGRRRSLKDITSRNATVRQAAERDAINTPVQGTAADLIKLAMVKVSRALKAEGLKAKMVLQVHDELLFDTPVDEVERVSELARREMSHAMPLGVPLEVSVGVGRNWLEAH